MKNFVLVLAVSMLPFNPLAANESPYTGQQTRGIKALSEQQIKDYLQGRGMGYAKAAELNHYPGPRHVLDLAQELGLSREQVTRTQTLFNTMQSQAAGLGRQLVEKEQALDKLFAAGSVDTAVLKTLLSDIGGLQAQIRYVHLSAHLQQKALLRQQQVQRYDQLREYGAAHSGGHTHSH